MPVLSNFSYATESAYSLEEIINCEKGVLKVFDNLTLNLT